MWPWVWRYKAYQCKTYTRSHYIMWLQLFIIANYFLKKHRAILSLKWVHLSLWEPERDISVGCCTGSKFAHSLFNLEHISSECPDPSYQVAWTSFDHIINDLNGTKKKRGRWINQGLEMDLLYDSESKKLLEQNMAFCSLGSRSSSRLSVFHGPRWQS